MNSDIQSVVVLGASGTIGSLTGGLIAQCGIHVSFVSRTLKGAKAGLQRAIRQARSEVISRHIECLDYEHGLESAVHDADLIIESVSEDMAVKKQVYDLLERHRRQETVVGTTTSSLPLATLIQNRSEDFKRHFLSTHFYNPPGRMPACETAVTEFTDPSVYAQIEAFLKERLRRVVIPVRNMPAFAGNRIAFVLFHHLTRLAEQYGVEMVDYLIGPYTGRVMPPLATIDLVGLDVHKAIMRSLQEHTSDGGDALNLPAYIEAMIGKRLLGAKTRQGFYKTLENGKTAYIDPTTLEYIPAFSPHVRFVEKAKQCIHVGRYQEAFDIIRRAEGAEAQIVRDIIARYISHAFSLIGEVTEERYGMAGIDQVMAFGFNWAPPTMLVHLLQGRQATIDLMSELGVRVPDSLHKSEYLTDRTQDVGRYFVAG